MRIIYYVDTRNSENWGGQATSYGMMHLVNTSYPDADFIPTKLGELPLKNATFLRKIANWMVYFCVKRNHLGLLKRVLHWYGVDKDIYNKFDVVCFNGEGAIHEKSGHFFRLLGSLYAFKLSGLRVYALNQTVDVRPNSLHAKLIQLVYPKMDRVSVREPISQRTLKSIGIDSELIGDAAYALPRLSNEDRDMLASSFNLKIPFIAVTASSAMERNKASVNKIDELIQAVSGLDRSIVFLANTKTDLYIAKKLSSKYKFKIISYTDALYKEAISIISKADLVVGGRQHPNIFAAKYGVPFIGLDGNTHKMSGVTELLNYPVPVLTWSFEKETLRAIAEKILQGQIDFSNVTVPQITSIDLGPNDPKARHRD